MIGYKRLSNFLKHTYPGITWDEFVMDAMCRAFDLGMAEGTKIALGENIPAASDDSESEGEAAIGEVEVDYGLFN